MTTTTAPAARTVTYVGSFADFRDMEFVAGPCGCKRCGFRAVPTGYLALRYYTRGDVVLRHVRPTSVVSAS